MTFGREKHELLFRIHHKKMGLSIPKDILVTGFNSTSQSLLRPRP